MPGNRQLSSFTSLVLFATLSEMVKILIKGRKKSFAVHAADNLDKRQQHNTTHSSTTTDVADPPLLNIQSTHQTPT
ncbi:hypothetical protein Tco_0798213 [Tanacetum coccineum]